jgi:hypothetical protein
VELPWQKSYGDFRALMEEEDRILQRGSQEHCYANVICRESGEFDGWVEGTATESLHARFVLAATQAGIALGSPSGISPDIYWLHHLFLDLQANDSAYAQVYSNEGGFVERLYEASTIFCTRLNFQSLKAATLSSGASITGREMASTAETTLARLDGAESNAVQESLTSRKIARGPKRDYETALRVQKVIAGITGGASWRSKLEDICFELDEQSVPCPKTWKKRGHDDWSDCLKERALVVKAIEHHRKVSTQLETIS